MSSPLSSLPADLDRWLLPRSQVLAVWAAQVVLTAAAFLTTVNGSPSLPMGLYVQYPADGPYPDQALVTACPPRHVAAFGLRRGYLDTLRAGTVPRCPRQAQQLLKRIVAGPGDTVRVGLDGVFVNGNSRQPPPPNCDASGRPVPIRYGTWVLGPGQYWLSADLYQSYDSRVFGPVHRSYIEGRAHPVVTMPLASDPTLDPAYRRADCSRQVRPDRPLREQVDLLPESASPGSLRATARAHPLDAPAARAPLAGTGLWIPFTSSHFTPEWRHSGPPARPPR
jgi:conjugative transfer signal peptidase TraF